MLTTLVGLDTNLSLNTVDPQFKGGTQPAILLDKGWRKEPQAKRLTGLYFLRSRLAGLDTNLPEPECKYTISHFPKYCLQKVNTLIFLSLSATALNLLVNLLVWLELCQQIQKIRLNNLNPIFTNGIDIPQTRIIGAITLFTIP